MGKIEDLLVNKGLYDFIEISEYDFNEMKTFLVKQNFGHSPKIDCFCVKCNEKRTFQLPEISEWEANRKNIKQSGTIGIPEALYNSYLNKNYDLEFRCTKNKDHRLFFCVLVTDSHLIEIGQYPSFADLSYDDINKYRSILKDVFIEYRKALGLYAHGIGIGSFVYLRRIIEKLVFEKYKQVASEINVSENDFLGSRFDERIDILKDHLPDSLVKNKNVYGIISKGIHELNEEECKGMFPGIKMGIELILDTILAEKERAAKEKEFASFIADQTAKLRK